MTVLAFDEIWVREPRLMVPRQVPLGNVKTRRRYEHFALYGSTPREISRGAPLVSSGSPTPVIRSGQPGATFNNPDYYVDAGFSQANTAGTLLLLVDCVLDAVGDFQGVLSCGPASSATPFDMYIQSSPDGSIVVYRHNGAGASFIRANAGLAVGVRYVICVLLQSTGGAVVVNGVNQSLFSALTINGATNSNAFQIGRRSDGLTQLNGTLFGTAVLANATFQDAMELSVDPYRDVIPA